MVCDVIWTKERKKEKKKAMDLWIQNLTIYCWGKIKPPGAILDWIHIDFRMPQKVTTQKNDQQYFKWENAFRKAFSDLTVNTAAAHWTSWRMCVCKAFVLCLRAWDEKNNLRKHLKLAWHGTSISSFIHIGLSTLKLIDLTKRSP